ncbi:CRISPR/Cas system-associated protein Cas4 [Leptotrichia shahii]|uniref:CRISPR/Cas system-associated protein Cas4 n=1 Tax=Leptotrichia shahii TaxID=157691 RepID=A0A510JKZ6_9FUSO|nr:PD-(D/E)XK nuclease family protein [Leptotrichia shahii]BBM39999.1 CRISPR/Cas system-associated protein Cas4 [Leptotrichia shahii]
MEINYKNIGSDLKVILFEEFRKNEDVLFVFENSASFFEIKREFLRDEEIQQELGIFQNFKMMNSYDFYENLFVTDKIVVKEEKQVVLFYNSLDEKLKKRLEVSSYYDIIDIAYNYYNLFAELQEHKINLEKVELEKWQEELFETLKMVDKKVKETCQLKGLILPYMLRNVKNISDNFLKRYKKIYFVNKVRFSPFEKELVEKFEEKGIIVENILQLLENDFDEKELKISEDFSLPAKEVFNEKNINIEIHEFGSKFGELLGLVRKLEKVEKENKKSSSKNEILKQNYRIFEAQENTEEMKSDYQLLRQKKISSNLEITMKDTKIYRILNLIYNLLDNMKEIEKKGKEKLFLFRVKDFYDAYKSNDLLKIFDLEESYYVFQDLVSKDYKYISKEELERINQEVLEKLEKGNQKEKFKEVYKQRMIAVGKIIKFVEKLEEIYKYRTLKEYSDYLEKIYLDNEEKVKQDKNVKDKYFEALSEMVVLEDFSFDNLWDKFFDENVSSNLLKLFLKYLDKKSIGLNLEDSIEDESEDTFSINSFANISENAKENIIILNLQDSFPKVKIHNFLFSKVQRAKMGLPTSDDKKLIGIFKIYQNILAAKNVYLAYVKDLESNVDSASVIEELKLKYGIGVIKGEISEAEELFFAKKYFLKDRTEKWVQKEIGEFIPSKLEKNFEKIKNEKLSLGYYSFEKMRDFEYGYYLEKAIGEQEAEEIEDEINVKIFGTIIHAFYENVVMENKAALENKIFKIDRDQLSEILKRVLNSFDYKVPKEYLEFYRKVSFEEILNSAEKYFMEFTEKLKEEEDIEIHFEERIKLSSEKELFENVFVNGVTDLHIKTSDKDYLFDYKSGKLKDSKKGYKNYKVDKALEQLDYYSLMLENDGEKKIEKIVVDTWEGKLVSDERNEDKILTKKTVEEIITRYQTEKYYDLGNFKDPKNYFYKEYKNICRGEDEVGDEEE